MIKSNIKDPPGTPPAPTETSTVVITRIKREVKLIEIPNILAAKTANIGKCTQTPSIFTVEPSGNENEDNFSSICRFSFATRKETGRAAAELLVTNDVSIGSCIFNITENGFY